MHSILTVFGPMHLILMCLLLLQATNWTTHFSLLSFCVMSELRDQLIYWEHTTYNLGL